jgi:hypothetical protein
MVILPISFAHTSLTNSSELMSENVLGLATEIVAAQSTYLIKHKALMGLR